MTATYIDEVEQWEATYLPVANTPDDSASWGGLLFETYGDDYATVLTVAEKEPRRVWTWLDGEMGSYIVNGFRLVNRIGYFITEKEWNVGDRIEVETP
jgi:hypothetical protein